ncbi:Efflux pump membrane transporter BepE [Aquisphaera giovannonii]|uniref:Efflux pump membrane transporter BepE n=1 Tax=Aquisphaera giovannonii TaxID=406548 RepID=A0A5B9WC11_9BACT|nr:efflux RND transporter permease subunit [Aquisphaera giovannonii]QEH38208.1 Efflux pump membrane transporter BepE [Aquisphaera giovannonii]
MISHFFIDRPIFASVLSIVFVLAGGVAVWTLPVAQYPEVAPPTVQVTALYPGANARTVEDTVAAPIEAQVSGVEGMMYMASQCTNDGGYNLTVTFQAGVDSDMAQVLVQNRVSLALPVIPALVQSEGINVRKMSPSTMMIINLVSPDGRYDNLFLSNYATIYLKDEIGRLPGVAGINYIGQRDYSLRAWLDPDKLASLGLSATDVATAIAQQNVQVAAGQVGQQPVPRGQQYQLTINTLGRLTDPEQFADIILKAGTDTPLTQESPVGAAAGGGATGSSGGSSASTAAGSAATAGTSAPPPQAVGIVRLRDVARVELGSQQYNQSCTLDGKPSVALSIFQLPGSNALETARGIYARMEELKQRFPEGLEYRIVYDTTPFIRESIGEVFNTLRDAIILVAIVVLAFLQNWRAAIIPLVAVPVAIIGTFPVMAALGFSLNNLSLFGLVLAIGIVVDDAIVVVENVERWLEEGLSPRDAARKAMDEVTGPVVAVALVLCAVFVPCAFISGITGQFFRQFAVTIAVSTVISAFNSLTLSPALAAILLKPRHAKPDILTRALNLTLGWFFRLFNRTFEAGTNLYTRIVAGLLRASLIALLVYAGLLALTYFEFVRMPTGFIPQQDKGYLLLNVQLPDSASMERTQRAIERIEKIAGSTPGVAHTVGVAGQSLILNANSANLGSLYVILEEFEHRAGPGMTADAIAAEVLRRCRREVRGAVVTPFLPPPIEGLGTTGGFKLIVEDRGHLGPDELSRVVDRVSSRANRTEGLRDVAGSVRSNTPWLRLEIDRTKCAALGVAVSELFNTLQLYVGSYYVNNFNEFGRTWQVNIQADQSFRESPADIERLRVRNRRGDMILLGTLMAIRNTSGPVMVLRYNMYPAVALTGSPAPGTSSGEANALMDQIAREELPRSMATEWTELTYLERAAGNTAIFVFALAVVFVFLVLAAQYESWSLPMAVILVVPMCLLSAIIGLNVAGSEINLFTQIGFVVLVGLSSKNAILIVEFAKQREEDGEDPYRASVDASRLRLRPILMTSFAFIFGVVPLVIARGAGAEMRRALGLAVFSGMLGVTFFGIFLTPIFFYTIRRLRRPAVAERHPSDGPGHGEGARPSSHE